MTPSYKIAISADTNIVTFVGALKDTTINDNGMPFYARYNVTTDKIPIVYDVVRYKMQGKLAFYDADDVCLSCNSYYGEDVVNVPRGTSYFRVSYNTYQGLNIEPSIVPLRFVTPIYNDNATLEYNKESGQQFFRKKITGEFTFCRGDFDFIMSKDFDFLYEVEMLKSDAENAPFVRYAQGKFVRTDCKINETEKTLKTQFSERDEYTNVLAGLDNEYDLVRMNVEKRNVIMSRRPMLQIYTAGESVINCFYDRHSFETDFSVIYDYETLNKLHFVQTLNISSVSITEVSETEDEHLIGNYFGQMYRDDLPYVKRWYGQYIKDDEDTYISFSIEEVTDGTEKWWQLRTSLIVDGVKRSWDLIPRIEDTKIEIKFGYDVTKKIRSSALYTQIYSRYVCDVANVLGKDTYPIEEDDPVADNRNYTRCIGASDLSFAASRNFSETANDYGIAPNGMYYLPPDIRGTYYPIGRTYWGNDSLWFQQSSETLRFEREARGTMQQKDFYTLGGTIKALLREIDPLIKHEETAEYSHFLYEQDPLTGREINLLITPKSNVIAGEYQTPAMKAPIHLNEILTMLKNTYQVYWYIEDGKFKLEHISFFERGGTYSGNLQVGIDLTTLLSKNRLPWAYGADEYSYEKADMAERYEFSWMDDVTAAFKGGAIQVKSNIVEKGKKEDVNIPKFTSDIDYILLSGQSISQDGFVLIDADDANGIISPDSPYSRGSTGTAILYPIKKIHKIFGGTTAKLRFEPSTTSSVVSYVTITFMKGDEVLEIRDGLIRVDGQEKEIEIVIPDGCDGITYTATTPSVRVKTFALFNEHIKATSFLTMDVGGTEYTMQNGTLSMMYLQPNYWRYNMPSNVLVINNETTYAYSVARKKTSQITFPAIEDPSTLELIKTNIGDGLISKMSINLSSRAAQTTLNYETE